VLVLFYAPSKFEYVTSHIDVRRIKRVNAEFRRVQLWFNKIIKKLELFALITMFKHDYLFESVAIMTAVK
jgi:hypothetical protein